MISITDHSNRRSTEHETSENESHLADLVKSGEYDRSLNESKHMTASPNDYTSEPIDRAIGSLE